MIGGQDTFRQTLQGVEAWIPSKAYDHESKFQKELQEFLDDYLNNQSDGMGLGMGTGEEYVVSRERGKSRGDVVVDDVVGIEMKRDLSNSQTKKLRGQIEDYADNYQFVIVCACGIKDLDGWRDLKNKYEGQVGGVMNQTTVEFVHKNKDNYGQSASDTGGDGLLGGDLF